MSPKQRIELAIHCLTTFPVTFAEKNENYKTYARLLKIWTARYMPRSNKVSKPGYFIQIL